REVAADGEAGVLSDDRVLDYRGLDLVLCARHAAPPKGSWGGPVWSRPRTDFGLGVRRERRRVGLPFSLLVAPRAVADRGGRDQGEREAAEDEQRHGDGVGGVRPDLLGEPVEEPAVLRAARPAAAVAATPAAARRRRRGGRGPTRAV